MSNTFEAERERYWRKWAARRLEERTLAPKPTSEQQLEIDILDTISETSPEESCPQSPLPELVSNDTGAESEPESDEDELVHADKDLEAERMRYYINHEAPSEAVDDIATTVPRNCSTDSMKDEFTCSRAARNLEPLIKPWLQRTSHTLGGGELMKEEKLRFTYQTGIETDLGTTRWDERRSGETWIDVEAAGPRKDMSPTFD